MSTPIKKGDIIKFKPCWQDEGDSKITFIAIEDEDDGRVAVLALLGLPINPWHVVTTDMIESHTTPTP